MTAYRGFVTAARSQGGADAEPRRAAIGSFEPVFYRAIEQKNGDPLNEVRMLCDSMLHNDNVLRADSTIKYDPATSVLKHHVGDEITVDEAGFLLVLDAFLADIERKFVAT